MRWISKREAATTRVNHFAYVATRLIIGLTLVLAALVGSTTHPRSVSA